MAISVFNQLRIGFWSCYLWRRCRFPDRSNNGLHICARGKCDNRSDN